MPNFGVPPPPGPPAPPPPPPSSAPKAPIPASNKALLSSIQKGTKLRTVAASEKNDRSSALGVQSNGSSPSVNKAPSSMGSSQPSATTWRPPVQANDPMSELKNRLANRGNSNVNTNHTTQSNQKRAIPAHNSFEPPKQPTVSAGSKPGLTNQNRGFGVGPPPPPAANKKPAPLSAFGSSVTPNTARGRNVSTRKIAPKVPPLNGGKSIKNTSAPISTSTPNSILSHNQPRQTNFNSTSPAAPAFKQMNFNSTPPAAAAFKQTTVAQNRTPAAPYPSNINSIVTRVTPSPPGPIPSNSLHRSAPPPPPPAAASTTTTSTPSYHQVANKRASYCPTTTTTHKTTAPPPPSAGEPVPPPVPMRVNPVNASARRSLVSNMPSHARHSLLDRKPPPPPPNGLSAPFVPALAPSTSPPSSLSSPVSTLSSTQLDRAFSSLFPHPSTFPRPSDVRNWWNRSLSLQ